MTAANPRPNARWCVVALLVVCDASVAVSQQGPMVNIQVENRATTPIEDLYIKKAGLPEWGKGVIEGSIAAGGTRQLAIEHTGNCHYDVRVVFQDGRSDEMSDIDLCQGLAVVDKPGEGGTPEKGATSGSTGLNRLLNR